MAIGTIVTSISFDIDTYNSAKKINDELGISFSRFVQISIRNQIKLHRKQTVQQYLDSLNEDEKKLLKDLLG